MARRIPRLLCVVIVRATNVSHRYWKRVRDGTRISSGSGDTTMGDRVVCDRSHVAVASAAIRHGASAVSVIASMMMVTVWLARHASPVARRASGAKPRHAAGRTHRERRAGRNVCSECSSARVRCLHSRRLTTPWTSFAWTMTAAGGCHRSPHREQASDKNTGRTGAPRMYPRAMRSRREVVVAKVRRTAVDAAPSISPIGKDHVPNVPGYVAWPRGAESSIVDKPFRQTRRSIPSSCRRRRVLVRHVDMKVTVACDLEKCHLTVVRKWSVQRES